MLETLKPIVQPGDIGKPWLELDYYETLDKVIREINPDNVLEVGVKYGYSACIMLQYCSKYIGIEINPDFIPIARENIQQVHGGHRGFNIVHADVFSPSLVKIISEASETENFDLIYLDAHHNHQVIDEINLLWPFLATGGTMLIDDASSYHTQSDFIKNTNKLLHERVMQGVYRDEVAFYAYYNHYRGLLRINKKSRGVKEK